MINITYGGYHQNTQWWLRWRQCFDAGINFRNLYLKKYSTRETDADFELRKEITPTEPHAKYALLEQRDAITQHLHEVERCGPEEYLSAMRHNCDGAGNSFNAFLSKTIIPELLVIGQVGVIVDRAAVQIMTKADEAASPYVYVIRAEDKLSFTTDSQGNYTKLLVRRHTTLQDDKYGLNSGSKSEQVLFEKIDSRIKVTTNPDEDNQTVVYLDLEHIPYAEAALSDSPMKDIAEYQIALLNLISSDVSYGISSNFPFYIEQAKGQRLYGNAKSEESEQTGEETVTGPTRGRYYQGEKPAFINPSPEPLRASIDLRNDLKTSIRQILQLTLARLKPTRASGESKNSDTSEKETGLAAITIELQNFENKIADLFCDYLGEDDEAEVKYPDSYQAPSVQDRSDEISMLTDVATTSTSKSLRQACACKIAKIALGPSDDDIEDIETEIEGLDLPVVKIDDIKTLHEAGLIDTETGTVLAGFTPEIAVKAAKDHEARLARIAIAQTQGAAAARGIDKSTNAANAEKQGDSNVDGNAS